MEKKFIVSFELTGVEIEYLNSMIADRIANLDIKKRKFAIFKDRIPYNDWVAEHRELENLLVLLNNSAKEIKNESSNQVK